MDRGGAAFSGTRASYVALCCTATLILSLFISGWVPDGAAGAVSVLGLLAVYLGSSECLVLFYALAPLSAFLDLLRLGGPKDLHGRGWLMFFQLLTVAAKAAGALFAWSLHKSVVAGESSGSVGGAAGGIGGMPPSSGPRGYARVDDPFSSTAVASYTMPMHPHTNPTLHQQPPPLPPSPQPQQQTHAQAQPQTTAALPAPELL